MSNTLCIYMRHALLKLHYNTEAWDLSFCSQSEMVIFISRVMPLEGWSDLLYTVFLDMRALLFGLMFPYDLLLSREMALSQVPGSQDIINDDIRDQVDETGSCVMNWRIYQPSAISEKWILCLLTH